MASPTERIRRGQSHPALGPPSRASAASPADGPGMDRLYKALKSVIDPAALPAWLQAPNPAFDGLKPLEVIESGEVDRLWRMVFDLESGVPA